MRRARHIPLVLLLAVSRSVAAQWHANVDLGLSRIEQTGIPESNALTLGMTAGALFPRYQVLGHLVTARTDEARWTNQALGAASVFGRLSSRLQWEISGITSVFAETNAQTASSAEVLARGYVGDLKLGSSFGLGGGTRRADAGRQPLGRAIANAWASTLAGRFGAELSYVHTTTTPFTNQDQRITLTYTDASLNWRRDHGHVVTSAVVGARTSNNPIVPDGGWGAADVTAWLTPRMALVAAVGQSPQDVVRGVPRIRYVSGAVRFALQPRVVATPTPRGTGPRVVATRTGIEIRAAGASRVEIMADFTDWSSVELTRVGDVWRLDRTIAPGLHRLMVRVDGGEWLAPANLPTATDDLGGVVALVAVP